MKFFAKERVLTPSWDLLNPSMSLLRKNLWAVVYLSFMPNLFLTVGSIMIGGKNGNLFSHNVTSFTGPGQTMAGLIIIGIAGLWQLLAYPGYTYMQAQAAQGNVLSPWESFRKGLPSLLNLIFFGIAAASMFILGLIAFIVPAFIVLRAISLASYFIVDRKIGPISAIKASAAATKPVSAWIWGTIGVGVIFTLFGGAVSAIPVIGIIGALFSYPYSFAMALRYNEITIGISPAVVPQETT